MPKLAIPLHEPKTARRNRRAVWQLFGTAFVILIIWQFADLIINRNVFANHTPEGTTSTILIELNQKNRENLTGLIGELQPFPDRGLTLGELLPNTKGRLALFVTPDEILVGLHTNLTENQTEQLSVQSIELTSPTSGITILSTKPVTFTERKYRLGFYNRLNPSVFGYWISHQDEESQVKTIESRSYGLLIKTHETSTTGISQLPTNTNLALSVLPDSTMIETIEAYFTNTETDFVRSMLHELKNYGGAIYSRDYSFNEPSFLINRAIPTEIITEIHNYFESGLSSETAQYSLPDQSVVYELIKIDPVLEITTTETGETSKYQTTNLTSLAGNNNTYITNSTLSELVPLPTDLCASSPSAILFPQKISQEHNKRNEGDSLALFHEFMNNFVEVSLDNQGKKQVIKLCF